MTGSAKWSSSPVQQTWADDVLDQYQGKRVLVAWKNAFLVEVQPMDAKTVYGDIRILVKPVAGRGSAWVSQGSLIVEEVKQ